MSAVISAKPLFSALPVAPWPTTIKPQEQKRCFHTAKTILAHSSYSKASDHMPVHSRQHKKPTQDTHNSTREHRARSQGGTTQTKPTTPNPTIWTPSPPTTPRTRNRRTNVPHMYLKCVPSCARKGAKLTGAHRDDGEPLRKPQPANKTTEQSRAEKLARGIRT